MPGMAAKIRMSEKRLAALEEQSGSRTESVAVVQRATIVLPGYRGHLNEG